MYAVIESGGKQHRVIEGETLKLEKIEVATGESVTFDKVLMVKAGEELKIGAPYVRKWQSDCGSYFARPSTPRLKLLSFAVGSTA